RRRFSLANLPVDCTFRDDGAGFGGYLDTRPVVIVRSDGLHLLAGPCRIPDRPRHRKYGWLRFIASTEKTESVSRVVPGITVRSYGVGCVHGDGIIGVLAD